MKSKNLKRTVTIILGLTISISLLTGCQNKDSEETKSPTAANVKNTTQQETSNVEEGGYPIKTDKKLTYWIWNHANATDINFGDTPFAKEMEKRTGVKIEYIHPGNDYSAYAQQFSLLIASGDMPDMVEYNWLTYPGGPEQAVSGGQIIRLNDYIDKDAPNLKKYLEENSGISKMVKTDNKTIYAFPFVRGDEILYTFTGLMIRKDWLDDLKMEMPTTIDDWYKVLKAFRDEKDATAPLSYEPNFLKTTDMFIGAYGISIGFFVEDGKVQYGPMRPEYKNFLETYKKWYDEGLLDSNFASIDRAAVTLKITTGQAGASAGLAGSRLGTFIPAGKKEDPNYNLAGAPYPTLNKGEKSKFGQVDNAFNGLSTAISKNCKDIDLAVKWLDYAYSKEGHILFNFGTEDVSYSMVNGEPIYTDLIMKNPEGLAPTQAMVKYFRASTGGPFIQDGRYILQYYALDEQKEALKTWMNTDGGKYKLPPVTATSDESEELARILTDINAYVDEMMYKFIMGADSLDNFEKYLAELDKIGIFKVTDIYQKALDRYNKR